MLKITKRPMEVKDFLKLKKIHPYDEERTRSKPPNFGSFFGAKAAALAAQLNKGGYSEKDYDEVIEKVHLEDKVQEYLKKFGNNTSEFAAKSIVVASFLRTQFFKMYPGCAERIIREIFYALDKGYVRHYHGPMRALPLFKLFNLEWEDGDNDEFGNPNPPRLTGFDKKLYSGIYANMLNICANTNIQGSEPLHAIPLGSWARFTLKEWSKQDPEFGKCYIFNNIHDSLDFYCNKDYIKIVVPLIKYCLEYPVTPGFNTELPIDVECSDVSKGGVYKHGEGLNLKEFLPLQEAINEWNKEHNTNLQMPIIPTHEDGTPFKMFLPSLEAPIQKPGRRKV